MFKSLFGSKKEEKSSLSPVDMLKQKLKFELSQYPCNNELSNFLSNYSTSEVSYLLNDIVNNYEKVKVLFDGNVIDEDFVLNLIKSLEEDNKPYVSLGYGDFTDFIMGLEKFQYEKWWNNKMGNCIGLTKEEILSFRGLPTSEENSTDGDGLQETLVYGNSKSHGTYFVLRDNVVVNQTIRDN